MSAEAILSRLERVRQTGSGRWIACCPAHDDRNPSLAIRELDDGRILVYCRALCHTHDVLNALGLKFGDLYRQRLGDHFPRERRPFDAASILACVATDAEIVSIAADNIANGILLSDADRTRLRQASIRIRAAEEMTHG